MNSESSGSDDEHLELRQRRGADDTENKHVKVIEFEEAYRVEPEKPTVKERIKAWASKTCTRRTLKKSLSRNLPFIKMLRTYKLKEYLPNDLVAGITVGIMMIPQGMAFGKLSTLTPVVGLYISLFAPLTYFFVGTGRQSSLGCIAVLSLMMASILEKYDNEPGNDYTSHVEIDPDTNCPTIVEMSESVMAKRIEVAGAVSMATGIVTMVAGKLGLGFVINFMSNSLITSFTVGVSIHVLTSQIRNIFGLGYAVKQQENDTTFTNYMSYNQITTVPSFSDAASNLSRIFLNISENGNCSASLKGYSRYDVLTRYNGSFKIVLTWYDVFKNIASCNPATIITSVLCMLIIYLVKAQINDRFKHKMKIPIPIELIVVIFGTLISNLARLQQDFGVPVVGKIHGGVPTPRIPDLTLARNYFFEALIIIIVAYAQTISMAKTLGMKNDYKVDSNQEMFATGSASVVCAIFSGYITAASVSRSIVQDGAGGKTQEMFGSGIAGVVTALFSGYMVSTSISLTLVQDGAGGKTQVTSLVACCVVLLVIMVLGPHLHALPLCVLSSIIIVNLRGMFMKLFQIKELWHKSPYDCIVWVFTFCATVILDTATGLMIGFLVCILMVVVRSQRSTSVIVGMVSSTEELRSASHYREVYEWSGIRVIRMDSPLYFANAEMFKKKVYKLTGVNPLKWRKLNKELKVKESSTNHTEEAAAKGASAASDKIQKLENSADPAVFLIPLKPDSLTMPHHVVLDMTGVTFLDIMGVGAIEQIIAEFGTVDIRVLIADVRESNLGILESTGFMKKHGELLYLTCDDAIQEAKTCGESNI